MAQTPDAARRAAVIGSGFGGLGAAIRLQSAGIQTVLYEARDLPGGRAYVYEDEGFTFDAGPTVITAPHTLTDLFELTGRRLEDYIELMEVQPMYRLIWSDGDRFDYVRDEAAMVAQIAQRSQRDADGYQRFFEYAKKVFKKGYTDLADRPFLKFSDMVAVSPSLIRLRADRSVYKTVANYVKDDHLRQALSFHSLLVGGNPFQTSSIYTLIHFLEREWGVYFPKGGTHALVRTLVKLFEELGGELRLSTPVESVDVSTDGANTQHTITDGHGGTETFDLVVSNADVHHTYDRLYRSVTAAQKRAKKLEKWTGPCPCSFFTSARTSPTRTWPITPFCLDPATKAYLMTSSRAANSLRTSASTSMFPRSPTRVWHPRVAVLLTCWPLFRIWVEPM